MMKEKESLQNKEEAVKWYNIAAQQGHAKAQYNLGNACYDEGEGVTQNKEEAVKWYNIAAQQGHAEAQYNLGNAYSKGEGVTQNKEEAVKWYNIAAQQGHADSSIQLGMLLMIQRRRSHTKQRRSCQMVQYSSTTRTC